MTLPSPPKVYSQSVTARTNAELESADAENHKRNRDVEIGFSRVILTSPNGTRYAITVSNAGVLSTVVV